jgi:hypothetical protein
MKLRRKKATKLYLDIRVNGHWKATYVICAESLKTLGPEWVDNGSACGEGSRLTIDIPVVVS